MSKFCLFWCIITRWRCQKVKGRKSIMKKVITIVFILLFLAAAVFFIMDRVEANEDLTTMRVKLSIGDPITYDFKAVGSYYIEEDPSIEMEGSERFRVSLSGNNVSLYKLDENSNYVLLRTSRTITFKERDSENHNINLMYMYNDRYSSTLAYTGDMMFYKDTGAYHIHAINHIYIEYYLMGVIGYEMSNAWPMEALKTQAVAARSYAVTHMGSSTYFDVVDTSGSQVYKGYNHNLNRVISAVLATKGEVIALVSEENKSDPNYQLKKTDIVCTFFSASNGGQMDIPQHVWNEGGSPLPWQRITNDPYDLANPSSREERVFFPYATTNEYDFPSKGLRQIKDLAIPILQEQGYAVTNRDSFKVLGVTDMYTLKGQVTTTSGGTIVEDHRKIFSNQDTICIDCWVAFTTVTVLADKIVDGGTVQEETSIQVRFDLNEADDLSSPYNIFQQTSLRITVAEPKMNGEEIEGFYLVQRRYGHGLGMSQRGAQTMAREGFTYDEILDFYYPNTEIWNLEGPNTPEPTSTATPGPVATPTFNATVNCNTTLNVRTGPGTSYSIIGKLVDGQRIIVLTPYATASWHKISFNEAHGYAHKDYIILDSTLPPSTAPTPTPVPTATPEPTTTPESTPTPVPTATPVPTNTPEPTTTPEPTPEPEPTPTPTPGEDALQFEAKGTVTCSALNVRQGPSTSYSKVGSVYRNNVVYIVEKYATSKWHKIYYKGTTRYVYSAYIKITSNESGNVYYNGSGYTETPSTEPPTEEPPTQPQTVYGTVTASSLNIRTGPSTNYSRVGSIPRGGVIEIREYGNTWSKIRFGGTSGYVSSKYFVLKTEVAPSAQTATVKASSLRIRKGPGTSYTHIGSIPNGKTVEIISYDSSWSKIRYGGITGYCSTRYLVIN